MSDRPRVLVVGAGVVGLCCAYFLRRGGAEVVVLERDRVGAGASSGNAGTVSAGHPPLNRPGRVAAAIRQMLDPTSPLYVKPRWDPELWRWLLGFARYCTDDHVRHAMRIMAPLGKEALALFGELVREERIECGYRPDGYYDVCATERGFEAGRHEAAIIARHGYHPEVLDADELRRREPALGGPLEGGVYYPEAATLRPDAFLDGLTAAIRREGVALREGVAAQRLRVDGGRVRGVTVTGDRKNTSYGGDVVIVAAGAASVRLARQIDVRLPVQPGKGYHRDVLVGPNGAPNLRIACVLSESSVFCTPMGDTVRLAGTMEFSGMNEVLRRDRLRQLTTAARSAFPDLGTARPVSEWVGLRPMSIDGLPMVGPLGGVDGLVVATGHGMLGLTLGPVTGEMVARLVLDGNDDRIEHLSPARFD